MHSNLSLDIICSSKLTVFLELRSRKTVRFSEQIMSADKYPCIFSRQMEAIVYIFQKRLNTIFLVYFRPKRMKTRLHGVSTHCFSINQTKGHSSDINFYSLQQTAFRKKGIRVNCVCPGGTDTDIYKSMERMELTKEQQELTTNTPKQRFAFTPLLKCRVSSLASGMLIILILIGTGRDI